MTREPDIWSRLQEYEIPPPQGAFDTICTRINLVNLKATGKEETDKDPMNGRLERLSHLEVQPPASLRPSIQRLISWMEVPLPGSTGPKRRSLYFYGIRTFAACLLLTLAGWLFFRVTHSQKSPTAALNKQNTTTTPFNRNIAVQPDSLTGKDSLSTTDSLSGRNTLADNGFASDSNALTRSGKYKQVSSFSFNGKRLTLTDNDLLITFVTLKYNEIPDFINRSDDGNWKIRIDQYTSIIISKPMSEMMKEMSLFKSDGSPTRKARKSREKLEKWKKSDEIQFDQSLKKNPLDPFDLGESVFK